MAWSESREQGRRDDGRDTGTSVPLSGAIIRFLLTLGWVFCRVLSRRKT